MHSITILHAAYAVWEQEKDATASIQASRYEKSLQNSIRINNDLRPNTIRAGRRRNLRVPFVSIDGVE